MLGTAATIFSFGAQAADLPVKAKPVEYVKVCNFYGAGFYYIPGTDTCLKIGAYIRSDHSYGAGNSGGYFLANTNARFTRADTSLYNYRARINLTTDWRTQTDYGVLRAYAGIVAQQQSGDPGTTGTAGILRAFIQFAGFTVGHAVSYFDFFNPAEYSYSATTPYNSTTSANGIDLIAYTWQLGNGWSASIDMEDGNSPGRGNFVVNASSPAQLGAPGDMTTITKNSLAAWTPDIAGNVRVDQAWGSAQVMAALHNASAGYYSTTPGIAPGVLTSQGHPGLAWGWAVGGAFRLTNFLAPRDTFEFQATYGKGATGNVTTIPSYAGNVVFGSGNSIGVGYATDGVFVTGSRVELTEAWSVSAAYEHYWTPSWRTSVIGGYTEIKYGNAAKSMLCGTNPASAGAGSAISTVFGAFTASPAGFECNPDFSFAAASTRTAWNPHPALEIGLDLIWYHLDSAFSGGAVISSPNGARPPGPYAFQNQDNFFAVLRVQKTVLP